MTDKERAAEWQQIALETRGLLGEAMERLGRAGAYLTSLARGPWERNLRSQALEVSREMTAWCEGVHVRIPPELSEEIGED